MRRPLPPAAEFFLPLGPINGYKEERHHIRYGPLCGVRYQVDLTYERLVSGGEVEETSKRLSSPKNKEKEPMANRFRISCLDDDCVKVFHSFLGEHGLSFLVETGEQTVLFDVGATGAVISHNIKLLEKDLSKVTHVVLSHAHYDHTGSLDWTLDQTRNPILVADPDLFVERVSQRDGVTKRTGVPVERAKVEARARLVLTSEIYPIGEGIHLTGRIPRLNPFEVANPKMLINQGNQLAPDQFLDDRSLILETEQGLVVLLGCCHAGLINTLTYTARHFPGSIKAVIGGTHLLEASPEQMAWTIQELKNTFEPEMLLLNHCTGLDALVAFRNAFGNRLQTMPAGEALEF